MVQEAILLFLQNIDTIKAYFAAKSIGNAGDQEEKNTIVNREDNGDQEGFPQDKENNILNQVGKDLVPSTTY